MIVAGVTVFLHIVQSLWPMILSQLAILLTLILGILVGMRLVEALIVQYLRLTHQRL